MPWVKQEEPPTKRHVVVYFLIYRLLNINHVADNILKVCVEGDRCPLLKTYASFTTNVRALKLQNNLNE